MEARPTRLEGVLVIATEPRSDDRGFFVRTFDAADLGRHGIGRGRFIQESQSRSRHRTLRGLHGRRALAEAKLVRCARGQVFDVVVDIRPWSSTFQQWQSFLLDDERHEQVLIPPGCLHGFQVLSSEADLIYKMDAPYTPELDLTVRWDDPAFAVSWPLDDPILSSRDATAHQFSEVVPSLASWFGASR